MDRLTINYLLALRGMRHQDLADDLRITRPAVTNVIGGRRKTVRIQEAIAAALGRKIGDIFPDGKK